MEDCLSQVCPWAKITFCMAQLRVLGFRILYRVWHRTHSSCTADEAWTRLVAFGYRFPFRVYCLFRRSPFHRYLLLNRNGTASQVECTSRNFNPVTISNELKYTLIFVAKLFLRSFHRHQNNLLHFETSIRVGTSLRRRKRNLTL